MKKVALNAISAASRSVEEGLYNYLMAVYTKKGDKGKTTLFDEKVVQKKRVSKDSLRIEAIGAIDEVNSFLGMVVSEVDTKTGRVLKDIQRELFTIGAILAGAGLRFYTTKTRKLETQIDNLEKSLPPLKSFILPGGSQAGAQLHFARSLVRRAERTVVALGKKEGVKPQVLAYLNRLSDFLFVLARKVNQRKREREEIWKGFKK